QAQAFNYRGPSCTRYEVRQNFTYDPSNGRISSEDTSLWQLGNTSALERWTQEYKYDGTGRVTQTTYPYCASPCNAPSRSRTATYEMGRPTAVTGFASGITYNDNGTLAKIPHSNHVTFTATADANGMARPGSLRVDGPAGALWPREYYSYDGAGNIT